MLYHRSKEPVHSRRGKPLGNNSLPFKLTMFNPIEEMYLIGLSTPRIASLLGMSTGYIQRYVQRLGISRPALDPSLQQRERKSRQYYSQQARRMMEEYLKRPLKNNEIVHHKNEDWTDNNPNNLQVMTRSQHTKLHDQRRRENAKTD